LAGFVHFPAESQAPSSWQSSAAGQLTVPTHRPAWQLSVVHALPSLQVAPSFFTGFVQAPVAGSQVPLSWHWSLAAHIFVVPPAHMPLMQASPVVHGFPSLHVLPSAGTWQPPFPSHLPVFPHMFVLVGQVFAAGSRGGLPTEMLVHVPVFPDNAHDWHPPVHAPSQQIPVASVARVFAQWAWEQSASAPHTCPSGSLSPHLFVCVLHVTPEAQSELAVQVVRHVAASTLHVYGLQFFMVDAEQAPLPSQVAGLVWVLPAGQLWLRHAVEVSQLRHLPVPSHTPSRPQVLRSVALHRAPGSAPPAGTGVQVPRWLATLQLWQTPVAADEQAVLQQTPSTQMPLSHWVASEQIDPMPFLPHEW
jgi:hypothetical protein